MRAVFVEKLDFERRGKIGAEEVSGARLQTFTVLHHGFHGISFLCARKLFLFGFLSDKHGHCKHVFGKLLVYFQHFDGFFFRFLFGSVQRVTFLPQKFGGA